MKSHYLTYPEDALAELLERASESYYNGGNPIMSDAEFDQLEVRLRQLNPDHPLLSQIGAPAGTSGWPKVNHPLIMGSLGKAQNAVDMEAWVGKTLKTLGDTPSFWNGGGLIITEKLDGISVLLTYEKGLLVRAATRGDGHIGEDITRNVRIMKGVPRELLRQDLGITGEEATRIPVDALVRGEIVCRKSDFAKYFQGDSNPRNSASGTAKRQGNWQKCRHLTVVAYNLHVECAEAPSEDVSLNSSDTAAVPAGMTMSSLDSRRSELGLLAEWGFTLPEHQVISSTSRPVLGALTVASVLTADVLRTYQEYVDRARDAADWDIDGLVVEVNSTEQFTTLGRSPDGRVPRGAVAFKFPHDMKETILRDVVWQVGQTGRITPVAEFEPVELAGANVHRASLHNPSYIGSLTEGAGLAKGATIVVSRRNDVIPAVESLVSQGTAGYFHVPSKCPACGTSTRQDGAYLVCPNTEECPKQVFGHVRRWLGKNRVLHFGGAMTNAVIQAGLVEGLGDLYRLDPDEVSAIEVEGRKVGGLAKKAIKSLHDRKEMSVSQFVGSLGITLCGRRMLATLVEAGFDDLSKLDKASEAELAQVPGFGVRRAQEFKLGFASRKHEMLDLLAAGVKIVKPVVVAPASNALAGEAFCFTGVRDKSLEAGILSLGGTIKGGVSKNVTILVAGDPSSLSGKAKKARDLGLRILSLDEARHVVRDAVALNV